ncbi:ribonuclease H-like domain-containing protein, partial [Tanacetum coccineum]
MGTSLDNLKNIIDISDLNLQIDHPNGTTTFIKKVGNLKLSDTITLYDVLYVPEYYVNLLSVHKLARDSKVFIGFDESKCYIQDLHMKKTLGTGSQQRSLPSHPSDQALKALKHKIDIRGECTTALCNICHHAKQIREPFPISEHSTTDVGEVVHLDVRETESEDGTGESSSMEGIERDASGDESLGNPSETTNEESTHASYEDNIVESLSAFEGNINIQNITNRYKARLVAKGYNQRGGIKFEETLSPVYVLVLLKLPLVLMIIVGIVVRKLEIDVFIDDLVMRLTRKLEKHRGYVNTLSFSADGDILVSGSDDRQ